MNKCIFQFWEESIENSSPVPDGCSLHTNANQHKNFIDSFYFERLNKNVPIEYSRIVGDKIDCFISDELFEKVRINGSIKITEVEKNNLIQLEEIFFKE